MIFLGSSRLYLGPELLLTYPSEETDLEIISAKFSNDISFWSRSSPDSPRSSREIAIRDESKTARSRCRNLSSVSLSNPSNLNTVSQSPLAREKNETRDLQAQKLFNISSTRELKFWSLNKVPTTATNPNLFNVLAIVGPSNDWCNPHHLWVVTDDRTMQSLLAAVKSNIGVFSETAVLFHISTLISCKNWAFVGYERTCCRDGVSDERLVNPHLVSVYVDLNLVS